LNVDPDAEPEKHQYQSAVCEAGIRAGASGPFRALFHDQPRQRTRPDPEQKKRGKKHSKKQQRREERQLMKMQLQQKPKVKAGIILPTDETITVGAVGPGVKQINNCLISMGMVSEAAPTIANSKIYTPVTADAVARVQRSGQLPGAVGVYDKSVRDFILATCQWGREDARTLKIKDIKALLETRYGVAMPQHGRVKIPKREIIDQLLAAQEAESTSEDFDEDDSDADEPVAGIPPAVLPAPWAPWSAELAQLADMGFHDPAALEALLSKYNGALERVIADLLR